MKKQRSKKKKSTFPTTLSFSSPFFFNGNNWFSSGEIASFWLSSVVKVYLGLNELPIDWVDTAER